MWSAAACRRFVTARLASRGSIRPRFASVGTAHAHLRTATSEAIQFLYTTPFTHSHKRCASLFTERSVINRFEERFHGDAGQISSGRDWPGRAPRWASPERMRPAVARSRPKIRPNSNRQLETIRNSYNPPNIKQITFSNRPKKSPLHAPQIPFHLGASNGYSGSTDSSSPEAAQCLSGTIFAGGRHSH
jgi:hypothetical protein